MQSNQKREILALYLGYYLTLAVGLIPSVSWFALGIIVLQAFYALIRYKEAHQPVYQSHLFNFILALSVSLILGIVITIQSQAVGFEIIKSMRLSQFSSANSIPYIFIMIILEAIVAVIWPIYLIARGLFIFGSDKVVYQSFSRSQEDSPTLEQTPPQASNTIRPTFPTRPSQGKWQLSAVMPSGKIVRAEINSINLPQTIGRNRQEAQIVFDDESVSRRHAELQILNGELTIRDLGSTNGTLLRGAPVAFNAEIIRASDEIVMGNVKINVSNV